MSERLIQRDTLVDIADAIRLKRGLSNPIELLDFKTEISLIETASSEYYDGTVVVQDGSAFTDDFTEGEEQGKQTAYEEIEDINAQLEQTLYGTDTGGKSFYDEFWDSYQEYGYRSDCSHLFGGYGWTNTTFKPKHSLNRIGYGYMMFRSSAISGDLVEICDNLGITLDFSKASSVIYAFSMTLFTRVGVIDLSGATTTSAANNLFFGSKNLRTIDGIILPHSQMISFGDAFNGCTSLVDVTFSGGNLQYSISFAGCHNLSKESITSVMTALSTETSGYTATFSKTAVETAFGSTDSAEWNELINTRTNWTISLV